jgi:hypothetical protein
MYIARLPLPAVKAVRVPAPAELHLTAWILRRIRWMLAAHSWGVTLTVDKDGLDDHGWDRRPDWIPD